MKNNTNWLPLLVIGGGLLIIGGFVWWLITGDTNTAQAELTASSNFSEVKAVWVKYEGSLGDDLEWKQAVLEKLKPMSSLTVNEQEEARKWLKLRTALNLIIVPDLSARIKNDDQIDTDKKLLSHLWNCFYEKARNDIRDKSSDRSLKDKLLVALTPEIKTRMSKNLQGLYVDLSTYGDTALIGLQNHKVTFDRDINAVYREAWKKTEGADYYRYINEKLKGEVKPSTWYDKVDNVFVVISDGYLVLTNNNQNTGEGWYTGSPKELEQVRNLIKSGSMTVEQAVNKSGINISSKASGSRADLSDWRVLLLEFNDDDEGTYGKAGDAKILKQIWYNWLIDSDCPVNMDQFCYAHEAVLQKTTQVISSFLKIIPQNVPNTTIADLEQPEDHNGSINEYDALITQAAQAVKKQDMATAKILLRNASKIRDINNLPEGERAAALYKTCLSAADLSFKALKKTQVYDDMDIPENYYELAVIIKSDEAIQAKLTECRKYRSKATPSSN